MSSNIRIATICQYCKKEFTAKTTVTKCCSDACAKRLYKLKKREEKLLAVTDAKRSRATEVKNYNWNQREYFGLFELTHLIGVSRWTLWRAIKRRDLHAVKLGTRVVVKKIEVENYINKVNSYVER